MMQQHHKLFVSFHKWTADGACKTPDTNRTYLAMFPYPKFELEKIITDDRTRPIGINGRTTGIISTENKNIHSFSSSALSSGFTSACKPSGILRIKNDTTEFNSRYFFDVENVPNRGKIF